MDIQQELHPGGVDPRGHVPHLVQRIVGIIRGVPQPQADGVEAVFFHQEKEIFLALGIRVGPTVILDLRQEGDVTANDDIRRLDHWRIIIWGRGRLAAAH